MRALPSTAREPSPRCSWHHGLVDLPPIVRSVWERITPGVGAEGGWWLLVALAAAVLVVSVPPLWRLARPAVTIAHELGHATVGVLMGRRFTGFVVSADMSGHAVTVGPRRGIGRILTLLAGYPAPAVLGAVLVQVALAGWAGAALFAAVVVLAFSLFFSRSAHTVLAVLGTEAVVAVAWWFGSAVVVTGLTLAAGAFLLLGAWRHLGAVVTSRRRDEDPGQLAQLTAVPAALWNLMFALVIAACTAWAGTALLPYLR